MHNFGSLPQDTSSQRPKEEGICLTELSPRLSEVVKEQNEGNTNTRDADNEIKSKLEKLEVKIGEVQAKIPQEEVQLPRVERRLIRRLQGMEAKLETQLQMQTKLEDQQTKMEAILFAVQTRLETRPEAVLNQLQAVAAKA
ncbi:hypothetical protein KR059_001251 [Drosophila kikkawai]|nr:hypothetical protein KR059_001251 [Drosophila kikkawai]